MKFKGLLNGVCLAVSLAGVSAFACDGVHPSPDCPTNEVPPVVTSPLLAVPEVKVADGGYGNGNNCYLNVEIANLAQTGALNFEIEVRRKADPEWILVPQSTSSHGNIYRVEMWGQLATQDLELRVRSVGVLVGYAGPLRKFSDYSRPASAFCQSD